MIVLGRIVAPYGVRGWVKIRPFGDDPDAWGEMPRWWLSPDAEAEGEYLASCRSGVDSAAWRDLGCQAATVSMTAAAAESLDGQFVGSAARSLAGRRSRNEYYWNDLIGLAVAQ